MRHGQFFYCVNMLMIGGDLLSQGAYGCVFKPALKCNALDRTDQTKWISKLQVNDEYAASELKIGEMLKKIKNYSDRFAPVELQCQTSVKIKQLERDNPKESIKQMCNVAKLNNTRDYIVLRSPFIDGKELRPHIMSSKSVLIECMVQYEKLLSNVQKLNTNNIIHHDLKSPNVLVKNKNPIVIDFGMSFTVDGFRNNMQSTINQSFVKYAPEYTQYPPEVHLISSIYFNNIHNNNVVTYDNAEHLRRYGILKKDDQYKSYKTALLNDLTNLLKDEKENHKKYKILFDTCWKTWDTYAVVIDMFKMINKIEDLHNNKKRTKSQVYADTVGKVKELCLSYIMDPPSKRAMRDTDYVQKRLNQIYIDFQNQNVS